MRPGENLRESQFRAELRDWLGARLPGGGQEARTWGAEQVRAWSRSLYQAGYVGLSWPAEYGGRGLPAVYQAILAEESARAQAPDHINVIGLNMAGPAIIRYGTHEQKASYLPRILSGDTIFGQGFSEPGGGSDLAATRTSARRRGAGDGWPDGYELNGETVWSSCADAADVCLLLARTDPGAPSHQALTCFLLDMRVPGVQVRSIRQVCGDAGFSQIILAGARTPAGSVLGSAGEGWNVAMAALAHQRGRLGVTLAARLTTDFARLVRTVAAAGADRDPVICRELAELHMTVQGLRYTGYGALATLEHAGVPGPESSVLKLRWSQAHQRLCWLAVRALGRADPAGAPDPDAVADLAGYWQRELLAGMAGSVEDGTSEILGGVIAEGLLAGGAVLGHAADAAARI
jgi:alkylation response protein AidB-like acyl-CoA dehydrogenase